MRFGVMPLTITAMVVVFVIDLLLFTAGGGLLVGSRAVYPPAKDPWDKYLLEERNYEPTLRCRYLTGFEVVERYYPASRSDGTGEAICPRLVKL